MIFLHRQNNLELSIENYGIEIDLRYSENLLVLNHDLLEKNSLYPFLKEKNSIYEKYPYNMQRERIRTRRKNYRVTR